MDSWGCYGASYVAGGRSVRVMAGSVMGYPNQLEALHLGSWKLGDAGCRDMRLGSSFLGTSTCSKEAIALLGFQHAEELHAKV